MSINELYSPSNIEQDFLDDLIEESVKIHGIDVYYLPRDIIKIDEILNEDIQSKFDTAFLIETYIENVNTYSGERDIFTKFGYEIRDKLKLSFSIKRWHEVIGLNDEGYNSKRPAEGDLVYIPLLKSLFEVKFTEHENPFYQLQHNSLYKLDCELFEYSNDVIETGIEDIDMFEREYSYTVGLLISNGNDTNFIVGERVYQTLNLDEDDNPKDIINGKISYINIDPNDNTKRIVNIVDIYVNNRKNRRFILTTDSDNILRDVDNTKSWDIEDIYEISESFVEEDIEKIIPNSKNAMNAEFEIRGNDLIDNTVPNLFKKP